MRIQELERAKQSMEELEGELRAERSRLRALTSDQTKAQHEKETVRLDLRRTESVRDLVSPFLSANRCSFPCFAGYGRRSPAASADQTREPRPREGTAQQRQRRAESPPARSEGGREPREYRPAPPGTLHARRGPQGPPASVRQGRRGSCSFPSLPPTFSPH